MLIVTESHQELYGDDDDGNNDEYRKGAYN